MVQGFGFRVSGGTATTTAPGASIPAARAAQPEILHVDAVVVACLGFRVQGLEAWVWGLGFRVSGLGVSVLGFRVLGFGFRV